MEAWSSALATEPMVNRLNSPVLVAPMTRTSAPSSSAASISACGIGVAAADMRLGRDVGRNEGQGLVEPVACLLVQEGLETGLGCMGGAELLDFGHHQHEIQAGTAAAGQRDGQIDGIMASGIG